MGSWGSEAWDSDGAADWFAGLMADTKLRESWHKTISGDFYDDESEEHQAALWLFVQLGRVYVWPIEHFNADLELAISVADKLIASDYVRSETPGVHKRLEAERATLAARKR